MSPESLIAIERALREALDADEARLERRAARLRSIYDAVAGSQSLAGPVAVSVVPHLRELITEYLPAEKE